MRDRDTHSSSRLAVLPRLISLIAVSLLLGKGLGCSQPRGDDAKAQKEKTPAAAPSSPTPAKQRSDHEMKEKPTSIGQATMKEDRTIVLQLRAEAGDGTVGDALFTYSPTDKDYKMVLDHLGGLEPGQEKPVPPWPEKQ